MLFFKFIVVMRRCLFVLYFSLFSLLVIGQDTAYIRAKVNDLSSLEMLGRGYVQKGDLKAAKYIKNELKQLQIEPLGKDYFQAFSFPMNTFPANMEIRLDGKVQNPVKDYVISPNCPTVKGTFETVYMPALIDSDSLLRDSLSKIDYSGKFLVFSQKQLSVSKYKDFSCEGFALTKQRSLWWASTGKSVAKVPIVLFVDSLPEKPKTISIDVKNKFYKKYQSQNILARIAGSEKSDSLIIFTAHYDHLGLMGAGNVFRGANDNATGTAMLLALAKYYSKPENKPKYSLAFLFFAAEERGLLGSSYYADNPILPLNKTKALINLDMVGTGSKGIAVVNGIDNPTISQALNAINNSQAYFNTIKLRPNSCNSDHCPFVKKEVPAVFIYTMGDEFTEYHTLKDIPEDLPLTKVGELFLLLRDWVEN